jgi:hypothetical protein
MYKQLPPLHHRQSKCARKFCQIQARLLKSPQRPQTSVPVGISEAVSLAVINSFRLGIADYMP